MGKNYVGTVMDTMRREQLLGKYFSEYKKFIDIMGDEHPDVTAKIDGYDEIKKSLYEANQVLSNMERFYFIDAADYRTYMGFVEEKMSNVYDVLDKYKVDEQMSNLLGPAKNDALHYPLDNLSDEITFQEEHAEEFDVKWENPENVLKNLCLHIRDVKDRLGEVKIWINEDLVNSKKAIGEDINELKNTTNAVFPEKIASDIKKYERALKQSDEEFKQQSKELVELEKQGKGNFQKIYFDNQYVEQKIKPQAPQQTQPEAPKQTQPQAPKKQKTEVFEPGERAEYAAIAKQLKSAKTFTNSNQYKDLITLFDTLGDEKKHKDLNETDKKMLLAKAGKTINDYMAHKAKDGIKPNVFKKLAAVEAASRMVDKSLQDYAGKTVKISDNESIDVDSLKMSLDKKYKSAPQKDVDKYNALYEKNTKRALMDQVTDGNLKPAMSLVADFMSKIMLCAISLGLSDTLVQAIDNVRLSFGNQEFVKEQALNNKDPEIGLGEQKGM